MKRQVVAVLSIISVGIMAGCGSSGSGTITAAPASGSSTTFIAGKVADGYLVNASVFLDKNRNYQLDAGEPSAVTDANGAYSLTIDPADAGKFPIVAIATKGVTIDLDTNLPVAGTYVLSMHAVAVTPTAAGATGTVSNFISPLSSQVRELMETGKYATIHDAMNDLRLRLGLPAGTGMMADYIATGDTAMHTAARNMATLMGNQMSLVIGTSGSAPVVDVNRYRGMMGTIFTNISAVRGGGAAARAAITHLSGSMMIALPHIAPEQPYRNMSSAFRGGVTGWTGGGAPGPGTGMMAGTGSGVAGAGTGMAGGAGNGMMR